MKLIIFKDGKEYGPYTVQEAQMKVAIGELSPEDYTRREDSATWKKIGELVPPLPPTPPPLRPQKVPPPSQSLETDADLPPLPTAGQIDSRNRSEGNGSHSSSSSPIAQSDNPPTPSAGYWVSDDGDYIHISDKGDKNAPFRTLSQQYHHFALNQDHIVDWVEEHQSDYPPDSWDFWEALADHLVRNDKWHLIWRGAIYSRQPSTRLMKLLSRIPAIAKDLSWPETEEIEYREISTDKWEDAYKETILVWSEFCAPKQCTEKPSQPSEPDTAIQAAATRNPFDVLGVDRGATKEQIRKAFLDRAKVLHPDRFDISSQPEEWRMANEMLQELNAAYSQLTF